MKAVEHARYTQNDHVSSRSENQDAIDASIVQALGDRTPRRYKRTEITYCEE